MFKSIDGDVISEMAVFTTSNQIIPSIQMDALTK